MNDVLIHYGVKGMKWGVRKDVGSGVRQTPSLSGSPNKHTTAKWGDKRYQNKDGTLTTAGKKEYYDHHTVTDPKTGKSYEWDSLNDKGRQAQEDYRQRAVVNRAKTVESNALRVDDKKYLDAKKAYQENMYLAQYGNKPERFKNMSKEEMQAKWETTNDASEYYKFRDAYIKEVERVVKDGYGSIYDKPYKSLDPYDQKSTLGEKICKEMLRSTEMEYYTARDQQKTIHPKL